MHTTIEELQDLADQYITGGLLNDSQLAVKQHMAECDECYQRFCLEYMIRKELCETCLISRENLSEQFMVKRSVEDVQQKEQESLRKGIRYQVILEICRKNGHLTMIVQREFAENSIWNFVQMPNFVMTRGEHEGERYESIGSAESHICYRDGRMIIQLDQEEYPVKNMVVRVSKGEIEELHQFEYDEDTELHRVILEGKDCSEDSVIEIIKWK